MKYLGVKLLNVSYFHSLVINHIHTHTHTHTHTHHSHVDEKRCKANVAKCQQLLNVGEGYGCTILSIFLHV